jgi:hypothetical protein
LDLDFAIPSLNNKYAYWHISQEAMDEKKPKLQRKLPKESTTTSRYLTFKERPMAVSAFAPSRHIGLALQ